MPRAQCPYLGLSHDPDTFVGFPDLRNCCHRADPVEAVDLGYQRTYCFEPVHRRCQVLLSPVIIALPAELSAVPCSPPRRNYSWLGLISALSLVAFLFLFFGGWKWAGANGWFSEPEATRTQELLQTPNMPLAFPGSPTPSPPPTQRPTRPTPTSSPQPTATPLPVIETPLVDDTQPSATLPAAATATEVACGAPPTGWVTYIVQPGDTLYGISLLLGVSIRDLQIANCLATTNLYSGQRLSVPNLPTITSQPSLTPSFTPIPSLTPLLTLVPVRTGIANPTATP